MQWGLKDEIDCTVAGRGDEESKLAFFGIVAADRCSVDFALMKFAEN
jgi:hypothetical protein